MLDMTLFNRSIMFSIIVRTRDWIRLLFLLTSSHLHQRLALLYTAAFCCCPEEALLEAVLIVENRKGEKGCYEVLCSHLLCGHRVAAYPGKSRRSPDSDTRRGGPHYRH